MASRLFGRKNKSKRKDTTKGTFVSYVDTLDQDNLENESISCPGVVTSNPNTVDNDIGLHNANMNAMTTDIPWKDMSRLNTTEDDTILKLNVTEEPNENGLEPPKQCLNITRKEPIYQVPRLCCSKTEHLEGFYLTSNASGKQATESSQLYHLNLNKSSENEQNHQNSKSLESLDQTNSDSLNQMDSGNINYSPVENDVFFSRNNSHSEYTKLHWPASTADVDEDYIDMQGFAKIPLSKSKHLSCSAIGDKRSLCFENQWHDMLPTEQSKSATCPPSVGGSVLQKQDLNENTDTDQSNNQNVKWDILEGATKNTPISAAVDLSALETEPRTAKIRPKTRQFFLYTVEEVVDCFEECGLPQLAEICKEETVDGEYFQDLMDDELTQEPFCLGPFHVSKVRKIIEGWRPRRLVSDPH